MRIKKMFKTISLIVMIFSLSICTHAATYVGSAQSGTIVTKTPTSISYSDLSRFTIIASKSTGKQAKILNATKVNGSNTTWAMRICYDKYENAADYIVNVLPYSIDTSTGKVLSLPFSTVEEGTKLYGKSWFYFVVYDNVDKEICGYAIAERIRRFPNFNDNTFAGRTVRNIEYSGFYEEPSSYTFMEEHYGK